MTARHLLTLAAFAALAAWVSAQGPGTGLTASDQLALLKANRPLLEDLLDHGLNVARKNTPIDRADECQRVAARLGREVRSAVYTGDADRLAEVSELLKRVVSDGLVPNLTAARNETPQESPGYERLVEVHKKAAASVGGLPGVVSAHPDLSGKKRAQAAREQLAAAASDLGDPPADPVR